MLAEDIFSRTARRARLARSEAADPADRWLLEYMAAETLARLGAVNRRFERALVLGATTPTLVESLRSRKIALPSRQVRFDEDRLPFGDGTFDLVIANGGLDSVNDLPGAMLLIRRSLRREGLFLGAMIGAGSLPAARRAFADETPATRRFHPQIDIRGVGDLLLRAGFFQPVVDGESVTARYSRLSDLVRDLRANCLSSALPDPRPVSRSSFAEAQKAFRDMAEGGKTAETFALIHFTGWSSAAI